MMRPSLLRFSLTLGLLLVAGRLIGCTSNGDGGDGNSANAAASDPIVATAATLNSAFTPLIVSDPRFDNYLHDIAARLNSAAAQRGNPGVAPQIHLIRTGGKQISVSTLGAGHIYVTGELLSQCTAEEDLAACIATACAHITLRQRRSLPPPSGVTLSRSDAMSPEQIVVSASQNPYSNSDNADADRVAYELFARGGWDPDRFGDVFNRLADSGQAPPATIANLKRRAAIRAATSRDWRSRSLADESSFHELQLHALTAARKSSADAHASLLFSALPNSFLGVDTPEQAQAVNSIVAESQTDTRGRWTSPGRPKVTPY